MAILVVIHIYIAIIYKYTLNMKLDDITDTSCSDLYQNPKYDKASIKCQNLLYNWGIAISRLDIWSLSFMILMLIFLSIVIWPVPVFIRSFDLWWILTFHIKFSKVFIHLHNCIRLSALEKAVFFSLVKDVQLVCIFYVWVMSGDLVNFVMLPRCWQVFVWFYMH